MFHVFERKENVASRVHESLNVFTHKFHILDHVALDVARYEGISLVCEMAFKNFNFVVKRYIRMTSMRCCRLFRETV